MDHTRRTFFAIAFGTSAAAWAAGNGGTVTVVRFKDNGEKEGKAQVTKVVLDKSEWKKKLTPEQYQVTREAGTERAYTGTYWNNHEKGMYRCVCCDNALFTSDTKFESGTGWPSFYQPIAAENVKTHGDSSFGMSRNEVLCTQCDSHLGHLFEDGPKPTGLRYCMNSASLKFVKT